MLPFDKALETVLKSARQFDTERIEFRCALNRILAEDIIADIDLPPFNKSAMDGFACRRADLSNKLAVVETIPAGHVPRKAIETNQCSKIMTGAMVPNGADCVIMKEYVESLTEDTIRFSGEKTSDNICQKAEDIGVAEVKKGKSVMVGLI